MAIVQQRHCQPSGISRAPAALDTCRVCPMLHSLPNSLVGPAGQQAACWKLAMAGLVTTGAMEWLWHHVAPADSFHHGMQCSGQVCNPAHMVPFASANHWAAGNSALPWIKGSHYCLHARASRVTVQMEERGSYCQLRLFSLPAYIIHLVLGLCNFQPWKLQG